MSYQIFTKFIKKYSKSPNVRNIYIIGHSQGARIAAALNEKNKKDCHIIGEFIWSLSGRNF